MQANLNKRKPQKKNPQFSFKPRKYFLKDLVIVIGVVLVWRGIWQLADRFVLPSYPILSEILGIIIGLILLYLPEGELSYLTGEVHSEHDDNK